MSRARTAVFVAAGLLVAACAGTQSADEKAAARNTYACQLAGERLVLRLDLDEARRLRPAGDRINLYRIASASGVRYSNGNLELRGKGMDLEVLREGERQRLEECVPYTPPPGK